MAKHIKEVLVSRNKIAGMCEQLGKRISIDYAGCEVVLVGVLKGAFVFMADLIRYLTIPVRVDFISVSSYGSGTKSTGVVRIVQDLDTDISGKHVIVVEDIIDTGLTLKHLKALLQTRNPASVALCSAFDKPDRRQVDIDVDYVGIKVPDKFIVGYGLDYDGQYRNLPDVAILGDDGKEEDL